MLEVRQAQTLGDIKASWPSALMASMPLGRGRQFPCVRVYGCQRPVPGLAGRLLTFDVQGILSDYSHGDRHWAWRWQKGLI